MARIENYGIPTSTTVGAPRDIYVDLKTGVEWECLWGISIEGGRSHYEWAPCKVVASGSTGDGTGHVRISETGYAALAEAGKLDPEAVYDVYTEVN